MVKSNHKVYQLGYHLQKYQTFFPFFIVPQRLTLVNSAKRKISKSKRASLLMVKSNHKVYQLGYHLQKYQTFFPFFIVPQRLTLVNSAKRKISKSNKSELWNHLSYRGLPWFLEVGSQTYFQKWLKKIKVITSKFNIEHP